MNATGFVKKIDEMGRIVIPKDVRNTINADHGDDLQIFMEGDCIILKKLAQSCTFCGSEENLKELNGKFICEQCISALK